MTRVIRFPHEGTPGFDEKLSRLDLVRLEGPVLDALRALWAGIRAAQNLDEVNENGDRLRMRGAVGILARSLATALVEPGAESGRTLATAMTFHRELLHSVAEAPSSGDFLPDLAGHPDGRAAAGFLLNGAALEAHARELVLSEKDGEMFSATAPVGPAQVRGMLVPYLFFEVDQWLDVDPFTVMERAAVEWWIRRFQPPARRDQSEFAQSVRNQEFALVERPFVSLKLSPLEELLDTGLLSERPRLKELAEHYVHSVAGAWTVTARSAEQVELAHPSSGRRYHVVEHAEIDYHPGWIVLGRLVPNGDDTWMRSPGAVIVDGGDMESDAARELSSMIDRASAHIPRGALLEMVIHSLQGHRGFPRDLRPPFTPEEAILEIEDFESFFSREADPSGPRLEGGRFDDDAERAPGASGAEEDPVIGEYYRALVSLAKRSRVVQAMNRNQAKTQRRKAKRKRRR